MALAPAQPNDRKRVKVYELKNNDWFDRGTGFCTGKNDDNGDARIIVMSEDEPTRKLLETKVSKDDGYQKQQDTLIVWTEQNGTDMALSFQEAEGCGAIWDFVSQFQERHGILSAQDDGLSDDVMDSLHQIMLPNPELGNLADVENMMRAANASPAGRDALAKFIVGADYINKLIPLVDMAEDLESLTDLHRLCNMMKLLILLNDTAIIEHVVKDEVVLGVVGALEYDPDFPCHKANHRHYLSDESRFKEVVKIEDINIKKKIHFTYRLQYLKDVVLARILDDPTFSVLNSLIFFHQVDIVQHLQGNAAFLKELFGIFGARDSNPQQKKDAVLLIQQCCAVAKSLQANARAQLYQNFMNHGLFAVITFALRHHDASVRVAGTDILVALIDHDALMMRAQIFKALNEKTKPLTDTLIELLLVETDLGVKAQMADAIKVLLDPNANTASVETFGRANGEFLAKMRGSAPSTPQAESFIQKFYDESARKLFRPLKDLETRANLDNLTVQECALFSHLIEVLCFFLRQYLNRSRYFLLTDNIAARVAQLMSCPEKYLQLSSLKYFRACIGLHDEAYERHLVKNKLFEPILNLLFETMPRDNLLNSACLELFEFIRRENRFELINHLVETYRDKLESITYVDTFQNMILKYDQVHEQSRDADASFTSDVGSETGLPPGRMAMVNGGRWQTGLRESDAEEEAYFNSSDNEDDDVDPLSSIGAEPMAVGAKPIHAHAAGQLPNGASPVRPLVDYPDDDDDDDMDVLALPNDTQQLQQQPQVQANDMEQQQAQPEQSQQQQQDEEEQQQDQQAQQQLSSESRSPPPATPPQLSQTPPSLELKRRREDDDEDDELGKHPGGPPKRRSASFGSVKSDVSTGKSTGSDTSSTTTGMLRRKKGINGGKDSGAAGAKKISISLAVKRTDDGE